MDAHLRGSRPGWGQPDDVFLLVVIVSLLEGSKTEAERSENTSNLGAFLGNYAESSSTPENTGFDSKKAQSSKWDKDAQLSEKYALQYQARKSLLEYFYSIPEDKKPKKPHRVCNCRRDLRPVLIDQVNGKNVYEMSKPTIYQHIETQNVFYGGLTICASPYACPVCVPKISEVRALEIRTGVTEWVKNGGICLFITLTFPHYAFTSFASSMASLKKALELFRGSRAFKALTKEIGYIGLIRSIEVTWGEANGFHPHSHEIWFIRPEFIRQFLALSSLSDDRQYSVDELTVLLNAFLKPRLFDLYEAAVIASGLSAPSYERGMVIKACETEEQLLERLAKYLTETGLEKPPWGVDDELTKLHSKHGTPERFTPFDFLRQQFNPELSKGDKYRYRSKFAEFVTAFKNTAKVYWTPGLKAKFKITIKSDDQIAEEKIEKSKMVYEVPPPVWVYVIGINDHRAQLLLKVKNEGVKAAKEWLKTLLDSYFDDGYFDEKYDLINPTLQYILENKVM